MRDVQNTSILNSTAVFTESMAKPQAIGANIRQLPSKCHSLDRYDKPDNRPAQGIVLQADPSAVRFNKGFADGKSEAEATGRAEFRYPINFVEDAYEVLLRDSDASIDNQNLQLVIDDATPNFNGLAR